MAVFAVERTAALDDAPQYWVMAGRLVRTGESFYVAAVDHKGPIWVGFYRLAYMIAPEQRWFWFVIAAMMVGLAAATALAMRAIMERITGHRTTANVVAALTGAFLVFGPELYSKVLYGRNITVAMTTIAVLCICRAFDTPGARGPRLLILAGVLLGLATSTVLTTAVPLLLLALGLVIADPKRRRGLGRAFVLITSAAASFSLVPLWYVWRGVGDDFATYFWEYNRTYANEGGSVVGRVVEAVGEMITYHVTHPYLLVGPLAAAILVHRLKPWRPQQSSAAQSAVLVLLWWVGEAISVVAPGRYFQHYWILLVVPSAVMAGAAFAPIVRAHVRKGPRDLSPLARLRTAPPILQILVLPALLVGMFTLPGAVSGAQSLGQFRGVDTHLAQREARQITDLAALRGVVEQLTEPGDEIFAWTPVAEAYVILDRPAATRFDRRSWLTGEVLGSDTVAELPGVWEDVLVDLVRSQPRLVVEFLDDPIPSDSVLAAWVNVNYEQVYMSYDPRPVRIMAFASDTPPLGLAFAGDDSSAQCWTIPSAQSGSALLVGAEQTGALVLFEERTEARRGTSNPPRVTGGDALSARTGSETPIRLTVHETSAALWVGDQIASAMYLPHGIDSVELQGDLQRMVTC